MVSVLSQQIGIKIDITNRFNGILVPFGIFMIANVDLGMHFTLRDRLKINYTIKH